MTYFNKPNDLAPVTKARSVDINNLAALIAAAFGKLPEELDLKMGTVNYAVNTGPNGSAYSVVMASAITAYSDGLAVKMRPVKDNTGACTLNVNGLGAIAIKRADGSDPQAGDIVGNCPIELTYQATGNVFRLPPVVQSQIIQAANSNAQAAASAAAAAASAATALKTLAVEADNPPANPIEGQEWTDATTGRRYTWNSNSACWAETYAVLSVDNPGQVDALKTSMLSSIGATLMNFVASGVGAVLRTVLSKLRETVSAQDFGAVGDGVTNDRPAIQKALDTGKNVFLPNGIYRNGDGIPLKIATVGQQLIGESKQNVYLTSVAGSTHDLLRVAAALADVSNILFRPGSAGNICVRIYAGWCYLHENRFLSAGANSGTAVVLTDQNPETGATVAGAYTHRLIGNHFGAAGGYTFARDIDDYSANGITATKFLQNQHLCDNPIRLVKGGGNLYSGNLFQSSTGTAGAKAGNCIDLGANVTGETITGNYFELYAYVVVARNVSNAYQVFRARDNHYDNVANTYSASNTNFYQDDGVTLTELKNGWGDNYSSALKRIFNGPTAGATTILELDDGNKAVKVNKLYSSVPNLSYTADNQTQVPASKVAIITGGGAARVGCILGTTNVQDGQELTLLGITWSVTLTNTNIRFANNAASAIFGNVAGQVQAMQLVYRAATSTWYEISRVTY